MPGGVDDYFTAEVGDRDHAINNLGYRADGTPSLGRLHPNQLPRTVPFYRVFNGVTHFYTTDVNDYNAKLSSGWREGAIAGFVYTSSYTSAFDNAQPLYRFFNADYSIYTYAMTSTKAGYVNQGTACFIFAANAAPNPSIPAVAARVDPRTFYRMWSESNSDHFYTMSASERDGAQSGGYSIDAHDQIKIFASAAYGAYPVYRLFSSANPDHAYTISASERDSFTSSGYGLESTAGYCWSKQFLGSVPWYRSYNAARTDHFYTSSLDEANGAVSSGWVRDGIACYGLPN